MMTCRVDVEKYIKRVTKEKVNNIGNFGDSNFTFVNQKFNSINRKEISKINKALKETAVKYTPPTDNDLPGSITIQISDKVVQFFIKKYGPKPIIGKDGQTRLFPKEVKSDLKEQLEDNGLIGEKNILIDNSIKDSNPTNNISNLEKYILGTSEQPVLKDILNNILMNFPEFSNEVQALLDSILLHNNTTKVKYVDSKKMLNSNTIIQFNPDTNTIEISKDRIKNRTNNELATDIIHEAVHSAVHYILDKDIPLTNPEVRKARTELIKAFKYYQANSENSKSYGFENIHEFVSELYSNKEFQEEIKSIENKSFFKKIIEFITKLLGLDISYNKTIQNITELIKADDNRTNPIIKNTIFEKINEDYDSTMLEQKLQEVVNKIKNNINTQIKFLKRYEKSSNKKTNKKTKAFTRETKRLQQQLEKYDKANNIKSVITYINNIDKQIESLSKIIASKKDITIQNLPFLIRKYTNYENLYSVIEDIRELYEFARTEEILDVNIDNKLIRKLTNIENSYKIITEEKLKLSRQLMVDELSKPKYNTKIKAKWERFYEIEYNNLNSNDPTKREMSKQDYITKKMTDNIEEIQKDMTAFAKKVIYDTKFDISYFEKMFLSGLETNSDIVQIFQYMIMDMRDQVINKVSETDFAISEYDSKIKNYNKSNDPKKIFGRITEVSKDGSLHLLGDLKIEFLDKKRELNYKQKRRNEINNELKLNKTDELLEERNELNEVIKQINLELFDQHPVTLQRTVKDKWKNDLSILNKGEKEYLEFIKTLADENDRLTYGINSLISKENGAKFYKVPGVLKRDVERIFGGDFKGIAQDKIDFITKTRNDDIEYVKADTKGELIKEIPIHFRNKVSANDQSYDLSSVYKLDYHNTLNFNIRSQAKIKIDSFVDVIKNTKTFTTKTLKEKIHNYFEKNKEEEDRNALTRSEQVFNSNVMEKIEGLYESGMMDIFIKSAGKIGNADVNKIISSVNAWTGTLGMSLNYHGAAANLMNGMSQILINALAGDMITVKNLKKAYSIYMKDTGANIKDLSNTYDMSYTNQLLRQFDVFGGFISGTQSFTEDKAYKKLLKMQSLQFMHNMGEHQLQAVVTMAILDNIDVIDKDGKIIKDKSLLDSLKKNKQGIVELDENIKHTNYTRLVDWQNGGKTMITQMIKYKIFNLFGNYDSNLQPEIMKLPIGRLTMMFRRFFFPMFITRYRGISTAWKKVDDITEEKKYFSYANQRYEEGNYVTTLRYFRYGILEAIKQQKLKLVSSEWKNLTDYEKRNIYKSITEIGIMAISAAIVSLLIAAADGDDDEALYFWAYLFRRNQAEMLQFLDPGEFARIMRSPFAALRTLEGFWGFTTRAITPWNWFTEYEKGPRKGQLKIQAELERLTPIINTKLYRQLIKDEDVNKTLYNYINGGIFGN